MHIKEKKQLVARRGKQQQKKSKSRGRGFKKRTCKSAKSSAPNASGVSANEVEDLLKKGAKRDWYNKKLSCALSTRL
jgi:hypothetical protein